MRALLALEDGTTFEAVSFTGAGEASGEVIFNTGMTGYQEVLTDPSYVGQMVTMTYPHVGNYGVNPEDVESEGVKVWAFIVKECCKRPSNWRSRQSLPDYLRGAGVLGIEGVDTRALTRHLRLHGAMRGVISTEELDPAKLAAKAREIPTMEGANLAALVTPKVPYRFQDGRAVPVEIAEDGSYAWPGLPSGPAPRVVVFDFGIKWNILRLMQQAGLDMLMLPSSWSAAQVDALAPDAIFYSPGPGDPATLTSEAENAAKLIENYPVAGICLGHQLLGMALGGSTYKLKFGHHGCNHPVQELASGRIEISSQNHGFCVDLTGMDHVEATHVNLNDDTLEGFRHLTRPLFTRQYHPEAGPGPHDARPFFAQFREMIRKETGK